MGEKKKKKKTFWRGFFVGLGVKSLSLVFAIIPLMKATWFGSVEFLRDPTFNYKFLFKLFLGIVDFAS